MGRREPPKYVLP